MTTTLVPARDEKKVTGAPTRGLALFVGHPKAGKTTTAAKWPKAYVLELEQNGGDRVGGKGLRIHDIKETVENGVVVKSALDEFGDVLQLALEDDGIETVVIDTIDQLVGWIEEDILRSQGKDPTSGKPQEKNYTFWGELKNRIEKLCAYLKDSGKFVILIAHAKPPQKDEKNAVIEPAGINVPGKGGAYIAAQADIIAYLSKRLIGGRTTLYMSFNAPSDMAIWSSRLEELDGKEFVVPREDPYSAFAAHFTAAKVTPKAAALKPAPAKSKK